MTVPSTTVSSIPCGVAGVLPSVVPAVAVPVAKDEFTSNERMRSQAALAKATPSRMKKTVRKESFFS